jgi:leucyl-tRNA synthetase
MMEFVNIATAAGGLSRDQIDRFVRILAPFAPHMAEELWSRLGHVNSITFAPWPEVDAAMLIEDEVEIPVQIMGKVKARVRVPAGADEKTMESIALGDAKVKESLGGKTVRKVIVVQGRIINIVVS